MPDLKEIENLEQAYFELAKIQKQIDTLSDFLLSKLRDKHAAKPKTDGMLDPRTGRQFRKK